VTLVLEAASGPAERERRGYLFRHLIAHLYAAGDAERLFAALEWPDFLSRQAEACGGFEQTGEDLERRALPAAIAAAQWERFLHYALLAINLRGLAEDMSDEPVLRALARSGRFDLAEDAVARLSEPARRAAARAILAAACGPASERFGGLVKSVAVDLEDAAAASDPPTPEILASLCTCGRHLGPDLGSRWPCWSGRLAASPGAAARLAWSIAEGHLERGLVEDESLWQALAAADHEVVLAQLPERLGSLDLAAPDCVLARLRGLLGKERPFWTAAVRLLGQLATAHPERAIAAWEALTEAQSVPWSAALVEAGEQLFARLPAARLDELAGQVADVEAQAAIRVVALAAAPRGCRAAAALDAVMAVPDGPRRLHWGLRYLAARPADAEAGRQLGGVLAYLRERRYDAAAADRALALDLAARWLPCEHLEPEVECAVFSPTCGPETLRAMAAAAGDERVLDILLAHVERYARAVSRSEAAAFVLRADLIFVICRRLCARRGDLTYLAKAAERLLPEEADGLHAALAADLTQAGDLALGRRVAEGIGDPRLRLGALLPTLPAEDLTAALGKPAQRYATLASVNGVQAELSALTALVEAPADPGALVERYLAPLRQREIQTKGLLRLASHSLAFEGLFHRGQEDRTAVVELVRASLNVAEDERLVGLTPEIAGLGAQRGGRWAEAELREAMRRVPALTEVPWRLRLDALEALVARLGPLLLGGRGRWTRWTLRRAGDVLATALRLPRDIENEAAREDLRWRWNEVLPILQCAIERLPAVVARDLAAVPRLWPGWEAARSGEVGPGWRRAVGLCLAGTEDRQQEADRWLAGGEVDASAVTALAYLLAGATPARVPRLVERLAPGPERDALCLRLIRHGWLPRPAAGELLGLLAGVAARLEAEAWLPPGAGEDGCRRWLEVIGRLAAEAGFDPAAPGREELISRLWRQRRELARPALGRAVIAALQQAGRRRGEAAVRLWLHAYLQPEMGLVQRQQLDLGRRAERIVAKSLTLSPAEAA
jgi:hypothetical protein